MFTFSNADLLRELLVADAAREGSQHDFGRDIIPGCVQAADVRVCAHRLRDPCTGGPGYWRDIGTVDAYWRTNMELLIPGGGLDLHDPRWPIWSAPDRSPPTRILPEVGGFPARVAGSIVGNGCQVTGAVVHGSVLCDGVQVGPGSVIEDSILLPGAVVGRGCRVRRAVVEEGLSLPDGTRLGDSAVPEAGLYELSAAGVTVLYGFDESADREARSPCAVRWQRARPGEATALRA